jgi:hypothetical protein
MGFLTEREAKIVDAVVSFGKTVDVWAGPIHAVDRVLGTVSVDSRVLVDELLHRGILSIRTKARNVADPADASPVLSWWEHGPNFPRMPQD